MKKLFSIIAVICLCSAFIFADEDDEEYDDGYVYEQNGAGDQFLTVNVSANFPLNFDNQVYPGFSVAAGYYKFIDKNLAVGGDAIVGYNVTIGEKILITIPVTFGVIYQPYINQFEFPLGLNIGFASSSCQGMTYFPALAMKASAGAFYRLMENWSFGVSTNLYWIPQWFTESSQNDNGLFLSAGLSARYHF